MDDKLKRDSSEQEREIAVKYLARVEGEGALYVKVSKGDIEALRLEIFEPPRFYEGFLRGRDFSEVPDITARICGICPVAYQMSSVKAMENALGITPGPEIAALRRLLYCGEWIESHSLHILMLHAPDFLGYDDGIAMAKDHPGIVERGLQLKKTGNRIVSVVGGREIHPINVKVGGFYKAPERADLLALEEELESARKTAVDLVRWTARLDFPDFEKDYLYVSVCSESEYPFYGDYIGNSDGMKILDSEFEQHFEEMHIEHSTALHSQTVDGRLYKVGPSARFNLNFDRLPDEVKQLAEEAGLGRGVRNPYKSIIVRSLETLYAVMEAQRIIARYSKPPMSSVDAAAALSQKNAGQTISGYGATEAPRGLLFHKYEIDSKGAIVNARIVPPTAQNQQVIEEDLAQVVRTNLSLPNQDLTWRCEQTIRNYDPCISCSTHFLTLNLEHEAT